MKKNRQLDFQKSDYIVYPKHGVGRIVDVEVQEISGTKLELYVIRFEQERMTLRVPTAKAGGLGMRKLANQDTMKAA
ncbi:MAG: CarD family transcriptional regulator, partial [Sphingomonadales bacterium]